MSERENSGGGKIVETTTEARAGVSGQHGSTVLLISTLAVVILLAGVYLYFFA